jgi:hypothetical protein
MILSDEEVARRLQDEENGMAFPQAGGGRGGGNRSGMAALQRHNHERTPIPANPGNPEPVENPLVVNARYNELNSSRSTLCLIFSVNTPQIIAAMVVLSMHWNDPDVCDHSHTEQWKWWAALAALRMFAYEMILLFMFVYKATLERNQEVPLSLLIR